MTHKATLTGAILDSNPKNTAISTYNGNIFDIMDPGTWVFDLNDIAHALSNICRFAGHVDHYSVGEHCLRVADHLAKETQEPEVILAGLLHDASEAYLLDIPRPWKSEVRIGAQTYIEVEDQINEQLMTQFGCIEAWHNAHDAIKAADFAIYQEEHQARPRPSLLLNGMGPRAVALVYETRVRTLQGILQVA